MLTNEKPLDLEYGIMEILRETFDAVGLLTEFRLRAWDEHNLTEESKIVTKMVFMVEEMKKLILMLAEKPQ